MSSTSKSKIEKDRSSAIFDAFERNFPLTLIDIEQMFGSGFARNTVQTRLLEIGAEPAHEYVTGGRVWRRWWWPIDIARAMWGEDVAVRVVRVQTDDGVEP